MSVLRFQRLHGQVVYHKDPSVSDFFHPLAARPDSWCFVHNMELAQADMSELQQN